MWMKNRPLLFYAIACFVLACVSGIGMPPAGQEHVIAQGAVIFYASGAVVFMLLHRQNGARLLLRLLRLIGYKPRGAVASLEGLEDGADARRDVGAWRPSDRTRLIEARPKERTH